MAGPADRAEQAHLGFPSSDIPAAVTQSSARSRLGTQFPVHS